MALHPHLKNPVLFVVSFSKRAIPFPTVITSPHLLPVHLDETGGVVVVFKEKPCAIIELCFSCTFVLLDVSTCFLCSGFDCLGWLIAAF